MKIFISWSGKKSHRIALVFRDWLMVALSLPEKPYVSSEDIDKGKRWNVEISKELEKSHIGILCCTHENVQASWLLFEAGALSKVLDRSNVIPFLYDLKPQDLGGPLSQFQATVFEKDDIWRLFELLYKLCPNNSFDSHQLRLIFDTWYPRLEEELNNIQKVDTAQENYEFFISYPMRSVKPVERDELRNVVIEIKKHFPDGKIFASEDPGEEVESNIGTQNFEKLMNSNNYILLYPSAVVSSVLLEIGAAMALNKRIMIFTTKKSFQKLPEIIKNRSKHSHSTKITIFNRFDEMKALCCEYIKEQSENRFTIYAK